MTKVPALRLRELLTRFDDVKVAAFDAAFLTPMERLNSWTCHRFDSKSMVARSSRAGSVWVTATSPF